MRDLADIVTAVSPRVRLVTRVFLALTAIIAVAATAAIIWDQRAMDRAQTALWTVSGPPCQRIAPVRLESLTVGDLGPLNFEDAHGAFVHGGVVCSVIDDDHARQTPRLVSIPPPSSSSKAPPRVFLPPPPCPAPPAPALRTGHELPGGAVR